MSCRIRERNPGLARSRPPARPSASPRPRPPGGLSSRGRAPGLGCSRHGRGAAPGRRQAEPLVGDSRGAQQFRVSARGRRRGPGAEAGARRPGRGGAEGRGRARPVRRPEGEKRPPSPRASVTREGPADPAVWSACHLAPPVGAQVRAPGEFCGGVAFPPTFCLVFKFLVCWPSFSPLSVHSVLSFGTNILRVRSLVLAT